VRVVDVLEAVDVDHRDAHRLHPPVALEKERQAPAIRHTGQRIGVGLDLELVVGQRVGQRELHDVAEGTATGDHLLRDGTSNQYFGDAHLLFIEPTRQLWKRWCGTMAWSRPSRG